MSFLTRSFRGLVGSLSVAAAVALPGAAQDLGDLDPCFESCHSVAMLEYLRGNEDEAAVFFEDCMETFCGGM